MSFLTKLLRKKPFVLKIFFSYLICFLLLSSIAVPALAQQNPNQSPTQSQALAQSQTQSQNQTQPPPKAGDQVTIVTPDGKTEEGRVLSVSQNDEQVTVVTPDGRTESGRVLPCLFGHCLPNPFGHVGDLIEGINHILDILGNLPTIIWDFIKGQILKIFTTVLFTALKFIAAVFGFTISGLPCLPDLGDWIGTTQIDQKTASTFNFFTVADLGISGIYQNIPSGTSVHYFAQAIQNNVFGVTASFAQGKGTTSIEHPALGIWQMIQSTALAFMVVILIVMGLMIMFRKRLSPQVSVTFMNSIPRVALALVLITFSFAISGLFIDLAYVGVNLVRHLFDGPSYTGALQAFSDKAGGELIWFPFFVFFSGATVFNWSVVACTLFGLVVAGAIPGLGAVTLPAAVIGLFVILLVEILIRIAVFAIAVFIFWTLLRTFALTIVYTILSPFFFLVGAIPGFESVTINWFKRMFANAIVFPVVVFLLYISLIFLINSPIDAGLEAPDPLNASILSLPYLIGIGLAFFATKVPKVIEKTLKIDDDVRGGVSAGVIMAPVKTTSSLFSRERGSIGAALPAYAQTAKRLGGLPIIGGPISSIGSVLTRVSDFTSPEGPGLGGRRKEPDKTKTRDLLKQWDKDLEHTKTTQGGGEPKDGGSGPQGGGGPEPTGGVPTGGGPSGGGPTGGGGSDIPGTPSTHGTGGSVAEVPSKGGTEALDEAIGKTTGSLRGLAGEIDKTSRSVGRPVDPSRKPESET